MNIRIKRVWCILIAMLLVSTCTAIPGKVYASNSDVDEIIVAESSAEYTFSSLSAGETIKIIPIIDGTIYLFSSHKMKVMTPSGDVVQDQNHDLDDEDLYYLAKAKKGDNYLIQVPTDLAGNETFTVTARMYPDNVQSIKDYKEYIQSGTGDYTYSYFNISERSRKSLYITPLIIDHSMKVYLTIQKKKNGKWENITNQRISHPDFDGNHVFRFGLKKGEYRIAFKTADKQVFMIMTKLKSFSKTKYKTSKAKAQKIKYMKNKTNIFTPTEKKARYYKVTKISTKKKRTIVVTAYINSGTLKAKIYKKGNKKCLKTLTLKSDDPSYSEYDFASYRLPKSKGTYYIKIIKSGKNMNGQYTVGYK